MGMGERDTYLATKIIDDTFIALDKTNKLTSWNVLTGKVKEEIDLTDPEEPHMDFKNFSIYTYNKDVF